MSPSRETRLSCKIFLRVILYYMKIFGSLTLAVSIKGSQVSYGASRRGTVYNVCLVGLILASGYFSLLISYNGTFQERAEFERIADTLQTFFLTFASVYVLVFYCARQKRGLELATGLMHVRDTTASFQANETKLATTLTWIWLLKIATGLLWDLTTPSHDQLSVYYIGVTLSNFVVSAMMMQYSYALVILRHSLRVMNCHFAGLTMENRFLTTDLRKNGDERRSEFRKLQRLYTSVVKISRELSDFYASPMLVVSINVFLTLVIYSYYVVRPIVFIGSQGLNEHQIDLMVHCTASLIFYVTGMVVLTRCVATTEAEGKLTGEIVNESLNNVSSPLFMDQLKQFSCYLYHANIQFSVYTFFRLDESLLISISGSITTYLVILLQFKESSRQNNR
ncbi:hypothetical protein TKK_0001850 [Trichogramma kaykai]|uniref:Gustatory receptor n=1 Tax=Trichogramma kaykai TaxID=54128 RepID=A0ABD2XH83_9HYME